jgi:lipopolysaccharide/colanic/teichoic acid biosynthesis glycosyltransferase
LTIQRRRRIGKRAFSLLISFVGLLVAAPLFPLIMMAIWLEDGRPFFFGHERQTRGGRSFRCFKFRTMCRHADAMKTRLAFRNVCDGPQFHIEDDPRLLRVGRVLRRLHLDELPQFFNVLVGHMDIVGPRPSPDCENQFCPTWREARLSIRPGITGLWQVARTRAPNVDFQEWIRYDLEYVQRECWRLDFWILWRTFRGLLLRLKRFLRTPNCTAEPANSSDEGTTDREGTPGAGKVSTGWELRLVGSPRGKPPIDDQPIGVGEEPTRLAA